MVRYAKEKKKNKKKKRSAHNYLRMKRLEMSKVELYIYGD